MAVLQITAQSMLFSMAANANLNANPAAGPVSALVQLDQWSQFLNDAILECWKPDKENPEIVWPYTVSANTLTTSAGALTWSQVGYGDWFRIWSTDPRPFSTAPTAFPVASTSDNSGIYPRTTATSVFVFWRPLRPKFQLQTTFVADTEYPALSYVYDPPTTLSGTTNLTGTIMMPSTTGVQVGMAIFGPGIPSGTIVNSVTTDTSITISAAATTSTSVMLTFGTGNVFMSLAPAFGNAIMDPTQWVPQTVPDPLVRPILARAEGFRVKSRGNDPAKYLAEASALLADEKARALPVGGPAPPWDFGNSAY